MSKPITEAEIIEALDLTFSSSTPIRNAIQKGKLAVVQNLLIRQTIAVLGDEEKAKEFIKEIISDG